MTNHPKKGYQSAVLSAVWWVCLIHNKKGTNRREKQKKTDKVSSTYSILFNEDVFLIKILVFVKINRNEEANYRQKNMGSGHMTIYSMR